MPLAAFVAILKKSDFADILFLLGIKFNESLQRQVSRLAFVHHHPETCQDPEIAHEKRVKALNCQLSQKTQKLLKKSIMSTSFQSQIIAEGFDHAHLNSQNLVELTINTVAKFEAEWRPTKT
ncbi:hypothetical protein PGTUg99_021781 [Puccinia graminis f. sp. tritici]|uniref:Uncharacterized protein n=1 Tax=Puccinia graminis f. sp. tritici TaxID=56615 RepID=A0A5B0QKN7_PUCGR|nr:hypothetical protein PGTUg99_021781 [Puccinia graminis f. sp. tritici]